MSQYFKFSLPLIQSVGLASVATNEGAGASWIERKPVAAAVLTLRQRDDGHVEIVHDVMTAVDEQEFSLPWLLEQRLVLNAPTLVHDVEATILAVEAAQQRFFVEPKLTNLIVGDHTLNTTAFIGEGVNEAALCRRLGIPRLEIDDAEAARIWTWFPRDERIRVLGQHALGRAVSRLMLWANLMSVQTQEPGWFYETMLALRCWLDEREDDAPDIYAWGTSKPVMRAVSHVEAYRRDLGRRLAGLESDWPRFEPGLFHM